MKKFLTLTAVLFLLAGCFGSAGKSAPVSSKKISKSLQKSLEKDFPQIVSAPIEEAQSISPLPEQKKFISSRVNHLAMEFADVYSVLFAQNTLNEALAYPGKTQNTFAQDSVEATSLKQNMPDLFQQNKKTVITLMLDCAKEINFILQNSASLEVYQQLAKPVIADYRQKILELNDLFTLAAKETADSYTMLYRAKQEAGADESTNAALAAYIEEIKPYNEKLFTAVLQKDAAKAEAARKDIANLTQQFKSNIQKDDWGRK